MKTLAGKAKEGKLVPHPILPTAALSCQPLQYPANRYPILPTATLSFQPPPYPTNRPHEYQGGSTFFVSNSGKRPAMLMCWILKRMRQAEGVWA